MRKYVEPDVEVVLMERNDVVTASNPATTGGGISLEDYDYERDWL